MFKQQFGKQPALLGIHLGNTNSCVAVYKKGHVEIIAGEHGEKYIPTYVSFTDTDVLIGHAAKNQLATNPNNTIFNFNSLLGRKYSDPSVQEDMKRLPFKIVAGAEDKPMILVHQKGEEKMYTVDEITAMIICKLREMAEAYVGSTVKLVKMAVPEIFMFHDELFKDAAAIAGLKITRMIDESQAACIAYEFQKKLLDTDRNINVLVFALGGATLNVSVADVDAMGFCIESTVRDAHFGGQDFDKRMVDYFVEEFKLKNNIDISENPQAMKRLSLACERAKVRLSSSDQATIEMESLIEGIDFHTTITREKIEELCADLFGKCIEEVQKALRIAGMNKRGVEMRKRLIHEVVLVGGSSQIPKVKRLLQDFFHGKELRDSINPREVVAHGAALHAGMIYKDKGDNVLGGGTLYLPVGLETAGNVMTTFFPVLTSAPTKLEKVFSTYTDNQTSVMLNVYEGLRIKTKENYLLGRLELSGLPPSPRGVLQIKVCFELNRNFDFVVTAEEKITGIKNQTIMIPLSKGLTWEEFRKLKLEAKKYKLADQEFKWNEVIYDIRNSMEDEKVCNTLSDDEKNEIEDAINESRLCLRNNDHAREFSFDNEIKELEEIHNAIISRAGPEMSYGGIYNRRRLLKDY